MKRNTVLLLDRNVVSEIEAMLKGRPINNYAKLKALDKRGVFVSPLLSVTEGNKSHNRNAAVLHECIGRESTTIADFFKQARVDSSHLQRDAANIALSLIVDLKEKQDSSLGFVQTLQESFVAQKGKEEARASGMAALELIRANNQQFANPCSLVGLATALGSESARQVLKPRAVSCPEHAFNAYADIEKISLMNYLRHLSRSADRGVEYRLVTFDKGLNNFSQMIRVTNSSSHMVGSHEVVNYAVDVDVLLNGIPALKDMKKLKSELKREMATMNIVL